MAWEFGNQFNAYLLPGQKDTLWQDTIDLNNSAYKSGILGFMFNPDPVKNEIALCSSVIEEYSGGLETGSVDPDVYLPKFLEKLKNAGIDKVLQESQKQLYEWRNNKK